jgi:hypothetical protein
MHIIFKYSTEANTYTMAKMKQAKLQRGDFYVVHRFHASALHGSWCATYCKAHLNFANESAWLLANNVRNEVVTIHGSQVVLTMLPLYM